MPAAIDSVLRLAATGNRDKVHHLAQEISNRVDEAERNGERVMAQRWRHICRVIDSMAELRFGEWWRKSSPARRADAARDAGDRA